VKRTLVRYKTKPDMTQENERLINGVFQELQAQSPAGVRYLVLKLPDGSFVHFAQGDTGTEALTSLPAFRAFQSGIKERCLEPPQAGEVTIVGNYRMLDE
jgi:hypothetical protein